MSDETLLKFPCDFPIKIIGTHTETFVEEITAIVIKHFPETSDDNIKHKPSGQSNFIAVTATVCATNKEGLDALYLELTEHPAIKMVL